MFCKLTKESKIKRILVVSLTNIGDVVLTCPVIDILRRDFPQAQMDVVVGPKAVTLFEGNPNLNIKVFDKKASFKNRIFWFFNLVKNRYDCVIDLRRTGLTLFLWAKYSTPLLGSKLLIGHKKEGHLNRLCQVYDFGSISNKLYAIVTAKEDELFFEKEIASGLNGRNFIVIAPGAADSAKRWLAVGFAAVADQLSKDYQVVFVGDSNDNDIISEIQHQMKNSALSLAGKINLRQLACVLKKSSWALTHDSGVMHLASYLNVPLIALWGPTDLDSYAPWVKKSVVIRRNEKCVRCLDPKATVAHNCMSDIKVEDVMDAVKKIKQ